MRATVAALARSVWKGPFADALVSIPGPGGGSVRGTRAQRPQMDTREHRRGHDWASTGRICGDAVKERAQGRPAEATPGSKVKEEEVVTSRKNAQEAKQCSRKVSQLASAILAYFSVDLI
jgi:hypothetical protein